MVFEQVEINLLSLLGGQYSIFLIDHNRRVSATFSHKLLNGFMINAQGLE